MSSFFEKLTTRITQHQSLLCVSLDPHPELLVLNRDPKDRVTQVQLDPLRDWLLKVIEDTADWICAYKPTLGYYLALGGAGLDLLHQILSQIPEEIPVILDAKHGDLSSSTLVAHTCFSHWQVDAITLTPYGGQDQIAPFLLYPGKGVFVLCRTANPSSLKIQSYPNPEDPLFLQIVREGKTWGTPEQLGFEVGSLQPDDLAQIRALAPERFLLARNLWAEGVSLETMLQVSLNTSGDGLIIPISQEWLIQSPDSEERQQILKTCRDRVNQVRAQVVETGSSCDVWIPDVCLLDQHPHTELILQLYDIGCILFGEYVQSSGAILPYYIDLRTIISNPQLFQQMLNAYAEILKKLTFDRIAGIPYGSLPTATGLALRLNRPMIFPRKEVKTHGTRRAIEGAFVPGETAVVVDDILITGRSAMEGAEKLQAAGLVVQDIVVFIDHEQGVCNRLRQHGYQAHAVLTISEIGDILYEAGRIDRSQYAEIQHA